MDSMSSKVGFYEDGGNLQKFLKLSRTLKRVLLAAPDQSSFGACSKMFKAHGILVDFVYDGRSCFSSAQQAKQADNPYDLVILSVDLPVLDGFSTAMLLKENDCAANIVSVSDGGIYWHESESEEAGCNFHIEKKELSKCVANWLQAA